MSPRLKLPGRATATELARVRTGRAAPVPSETPSPASTCAVKKTKTTMQASISSLLYLDAHRMATFYCVVLSDPLTTPTRPSLAQPWQAATRA